MSSSKDKMMAAAAGEEEEVDELLAAISASGGAIRSLPRKLDSLLSEPKYGLQQAEKDEIGLLKHDLEELISSYLIEPSEVQAPALTAERWVKEVRELSYDIDDFVDELFHDGANARISFARKTSRVKIARLQKKTSPRGWITAEITGFRTRVKEVIQRHIRYHLDKRTMRPNWGVPDEGQLPQLHLHGEEVVLGSMKELESKLLTDDGDGEQHKLKVVSITGFSGVGKTTLANQLYSHLRGRFECRAFVRTSRKPDMRRLLTNMLAQLRRHQPIDAWEVPDLINNIRRHLQDKKYFIIIDDLWTLSTWDIVSCALPDSNRCGRVLITTEVDIVAQACCGYKSNNIVTMKPLSDNESTELFLSVAFGHEHECSGQLDEVSCAIIRKCGGLPLAVITIASLLASQRNRNVKQYWNYIHNSMSFNLGTNPTLEGMKQVLNLSYNSLPQRLKACMLYLSIYQEDYIISKDDLVKQWIAEGFISEVEGKDMEEVAERYFNELINKGMIQPVDINYNGDVLSCTVHYMVLNLIRYKSIEENFITTIDHSQTAIRLADKVRRLSLHFGNEEDATPPANMRLSQVRSLAFSGFFKCMPSITEFKLLRVLILKLWVDHDDTSYNLNEISKLFRLRYLYIDACHLSLELPTEMRLLKDLVTLKIDAKVSEVPLDIVHLLGLFHLHLPGETNLPDSIGHMTSLRTLAYYNLSSNSEDNVLNLGELTNLRDLCLTCSTELPNNLESNMQHLGSILGKLGNLKSLILNTMDDVGATSMSISCDGLSSMSVPPAVLERLEFSRRICTFSGLPSWIGKLNKLCILKIAVRVLLQNDIDILKGLPALTALSLYVLVSPLDRIVFDGAGFRILKYFKFVCTAPCLAFIKGALPNVRRLKLGFNANRMEQHNLKRAGFEHLTGLKEISAKIGGAFADAESVLITAVSKHASNPRINVQLVDWKFYDDEDRSMSRREQEHLTPEEQDEILQKHSYQYFGTQDEDPREVEKKQADSRISTLPTICDKAVALVGTDDPREEKVSYVPTETMEFGAMGSLLTKLGELLKEYKLQKGVRVQVQSLSRELMMMHAALCKVVEVPHEQLDKQVKLWARDVRELSYDMEDVIDTFRVRMEDGREATKNTHRLKKLMKKMSNLFSKDKARYQIAEAIQDINKQLQEVANRHGRYTVDNIVVNPAATSTINPRLLAMYKDATQLVGIDGPRDTLIKMLSEGDDASDKKKMKIVSIVGFGGLGKTTLAKAVYHKLKEGFNCCAFVSVGQNPDMKKVFKDILIDLNKQKYMNLNMTMLAESQLIDELRQFLENKRYFIIIDDVWDKKSWELIRCALPDSNCGSRVVTTTRISEVATNAGDIYELQPLSRDNSKKLFNTRIVECEGKLPHNQSTEVYDAILNKCDGVPLAIITIASLLARKPEEDWHEVYNSIGFGHGDNDVVKNTRKILSFSYYDLPSHLKTCLLYLSVFPEDYWIEKNLLIRKWIAEGFVHDEHGIGLLDIGERYFNELINRNMIKPDEIRETEHVIGCRVHDMVLDLIRSLSSEENFVTILDNEQQTFQHSNARRLALQKGFEEHSPLSNMGVQHVRSFTAILCDTRMISPSFRVLRVLAIECCVFMEGYRFSLEHLGNLLHLRYLGLSGTPVRELPRKIGDLKFLQTLELTGTSIEELPLSASLLTQLLCLRANKKTRVPDWIGNLTSLQELWIWPAVDSSARFVKELGNLRELRELVTTIDVREESLERDLVESLSNLHKIQSLAILGKPLEKGATWEAGPVSPRLLHSMRLGCLEFSRLPAWINPSLLSNLYLLGVNVQVMQEQDMETLGRLPQLRSLHLLSRYTPVVSIIGGDGQLFHKLRSFTTDTFIRFVHIMPRLEDLELDVHVRFLKDANLGFDKLGLENLPSLQRVTAEINCSYARAAEVEEAEVVLRHAATVHPNRPTLTTTRKFEAEMLSPGQDHVATRWSRKVLDLGVNVRELKDEKHYFNFRWLLWNPCVEKLSVRINCEDASVGEVEEAEAALRHVVDVHSNHPTFEITRDGEDKMMLSDQHQQQQEELGTEDDEHSSDFESDENGDGAEDD